MKIELLNLEAIVDRDVIIQAENAAAEASKCWAPRVQNMHPLARDTQEPHGYFLHLRLQRHSFIAQANNFQYAFIWSIVVIRFYAVYMARCLVHTRQL